MLVSITSSSSLLSKRKTDDAKLDDKDIVVIGDADAASATKNQKRTLESKLTHPSSNSTLKVDTSNHALFSLFDSGNDSRYPVTSRKASSSSLLD